MPVASSPLPHLRLATRGSALALAQADLTEAALSQAFPGITLERVVIQTSGDRFTDRPLAEIGGKALFTKEIDEALLENRADLAVHSLKDVPSDLPDGLMLAGCLPRAEVRDVLICGHRQLGSLMNLPRDCLLGTSSPRRALQALALRPDLRIAPIRGNVATRIAKTESGEFEATLLAAAGMHRLQMPVAAYLSVQEMLPAVGQGIIGLACRTADAPIISMLQQITHSQSWHAMQAERSLLAAMEGTCRSPIAALAEISDAELTLHGYVSAAEGGLHARHRLQGSVTHAAALGHALAELLLREVPRAHFA